MNIRLSQAEFCLSKRLTLSIFDGAGVRVDARAGVVWFTRDNDRRDGVLQAGESILLDRRRRGDRCRAGPGLGIGQLPD
jgi:hypothetical protein